MTDDSERRRLAKLHGRDDGPPAVPAATVVLVRPGPEEHPELLMVRRDSKLSFAGGLWVFPGGKVDPSDYPPDDPDDLPRAEQAAAIREAEEEAGLRVAIDSLVRLSHWTPPPQSHKRYTTAFFVAPAPEGTVTIDDSEIRDHRWVGAVAALEAHRDGTIELAPPTFITLTQLCGLSTVAELLEFVATSDTEHFATRITVTDDEVVALYHGDVAYDDGEVDRPGPRHRLWLDPDGWRYERTRR